MRSLCITSSFLSSGVHVNVNVATPPLHFGWPPSVDNQLDYPLSQSHGKDRKDTGGAFHWTLTRDEESCLCVLKSVPNGSGLAYS